MKDPVIEDEMIDFFRAMKDIPAREPARAGEGKKAFLEEARSLHPAVSKTADSRLNQQRVFGKERIAMWKIAGALLMAVGVVFGGGGAVVAGAQEAMPEDALYPVKVWSEDVRLWAESAPLSKMDLALQFADRRAEELIHQFDAGLPVEDAVMLRLMEEDDLALAIAADAGDAEAPAALEKVRTRMENQERALEYLGLGAGPDESALLLQTRQMIRQRLELLQGDLHDPQVRARILEQVRLRVNRQDTAPAGQTNQNGNGGTDQGSPSEPGSGGNGPQAEGTPAPGGGNGPGPEACVCPVSCEGPGAGGPGNKPNAEVTPAGDGCVCPTLVCTPKGGGQKQNGQP
jgi:hypothetical protein